MAAAAHKLRLQAQLQALLLEARDRLQDGSDDLRCAPTATLAVGIHPRCAAPDGIHSAVARRVRALAISLFQSLH